MDAIVRTLGKIDAAISAFLKGLSICLFVVLAVIMTLNILNRFVPVTSFHWLDEIVEICFAGMVFYGSAAVWMAKGHFSAGDWISKRLPSDRARHAYRLVVELASLAFMLLVLRFSWDLAARARETTAVFQIPKAVLYSCMPVSALVMSLYSAANALVLVAKIVRPRE